MVRVIAQPSGMTGESTDAGAKNRLKGVHTVVVLGIILLIIGLIVASLHVLFYIGLVLLIVGLILNFVPMGGSNRRRVW